MKEAVWRLSGWAVRTAIGVAALLTAQPPNRLTAQVGHDPRTLPIAISCCTRVRYSLSAT